MINRAHFENPAMVHGLEHAPGDQRLNVGCGLRTPEGFWNTDMCEGAGVDQVVNLMDLPLPWKDNEWDFIMASHVLEHIPHHIPGQKMEGDLLFHLINEFIRVLKPDGILEVHTPAGPDAMFVIDHCRFVNTITFRGWDPEHGNYNLLAEEHQKSGPGMKQIARFKKRDFHLGPINMWHTRRYLGLELGSVHQEVLIYQVLK